MVLTIFVSLIFHLSTVRVVQGNRSFVSGQLIEAKQKELESFFNNQVWHFAPSSEADPQRVLKARFLLNWKKNADGSPRAKARLIVQGFRDPDALNGTLNTASTTLTRLSRNFILTVATMQKFDLFTADITTAFLQGKEFPDRSDRVIWIKLPRDGERLLGLEGDHGQLMKLTKPMYGRYCVSQGFSGTILDVSL